MTIKWEYKANQLIKELTIAQQQMVEIVKSNFL